MIVCKCQDAKNKRNNKRRINAKLYMSKCVVCALIIIDIDKTVLLEGVRPTSLAITTSIRALAATT